MSTCLRRLRMLDAFRRVFSLPHIQPIQKQRHDSEARVVRNSDSSCPILSKLSPATT